MKRLSLLIALLVCFVTVTAQEGGIKGRVVSRNGRNAVPDVEVTLSGGAKAVTDKDGYFIIKNLPKGDYRLNISAAEYENLELPVKVDYTLKDINNIVIVPQRLAEGVDESVFAEIDNDSSANDNQALPTALAASKDVYNSIATYKFSEMRFNLRGYDSQYSDIYLNGIRFNDALTGYGPWSLWSGLNDATRNQDNVTGLNISEHGIGGINGVTNINARASQVRKGLRASVASGATTYRLRAMITYGSGQLDNGWSYALSFSTRQGSHMYVDGVYYNSFGYFASVEKLFRERHRLSLSILGTPQERGAQQASTEEAYEMFGSKYYNPNVGYQNGKLRNTRVRVSHEPIVMLNYLFKISDRTKLSAATSLRFGKNGYSALTWQEGADPRPDYYRYLPSNYLNQYSSGVEGMFQETSAAELESLIAAAVNARLVWNGRVDFDAMQRANRRWDPTIDYAQGYRSNYMIEERHTDQLDYNFVANFHTELSKKSTIFGGVRLRVNRTEYYDQVKDLLGGTFWVDTDKFAERDMGSNAIAYQNDVDYYLLTGHPRAVKEGDKFSYDYYANVRQAQLWANYSLSTGKLRLKLAAEGGYSSTWREGKMRKGLFLQGNDSYGESEHLNYFTYKAKANVALRFSGAHSVEVNLTSMQNAPSFQSSFVSPRTRNQTNPGIKAEKILGAELTYNVNLPFLKARVSGFFTNMKDGAKVISYYDDTRSSFTNFAMSGIDKRYYGVEVGLNIPLYTGLSLNAALNYGEYTYTSNPQFTQIVDNSAKVILKDKVYWDGMYVEGSPQTALNVGLSYRTPHYWYLSADFNYYDRSYLSMNPAYRTSAAIKSYADVLNQEEATNDAFIYSIQQINQIRKQEKLDSAYTLNASVGKSWYIHRKYTLGFSAEVKNLTNNRSVKTGGYEQMRLRKQRGGNGTATSSSPACDYYYRFDSKYFYMMGISYYLNVYFRF